MKNAFLVLWLVAYSGPPMTVAVLAAILAFEGLASLRTHPENAGLTMASALFLIAWPLSALAGWVLLALGETRGAWLVRGVMAAGLALPGLLGLGLAAAVSGDSGASLRRTTSPTGGTAGLGNREAGRWPCLGPESVRLERSCIGSRT